MGPVEKSQSTSVAVPPWFPVLQVEPPAHYLRRPCVTVCDDLLTDKRRCNNNSIVSAIPMMIKQCRTPLPLLISLSCLVVAAASQSVQPIKAAPARQDGVLSIEHKQIPLGDDNVNVIVYTNPFKRLGASFLSLHNDEQVGVVVLLSRIMQDGGIFGAVIPPLHITGVPCRYAGFRIDGIRYQIDPNRLWDDAKLEPYKVDSCLGVNKGDSNQKVSDKDVLARIRASVSGFRSTLLNLLAVNQGAGDGRYLVAIHNNRDLHYTFEDVQKKQCGVKSPVVKDVPRDRQSDFFLVTSKEDYAHFVGQGYNVVWQQEVALSDNECQDGSLSLFAQSKGIPFITIEVNKQGESKEDPGESSGRPRSAESSQVVASKMINSVFSFLKSKSNSSP
jgi:hypothetical protein